MSPLPTLSPTLTAALRAGTVIPAHPLALDDEGRFDDISQRALTRYYLAAGAGGIAVGVHTTQFAIRDPRHGLLRPVLELAAETTAEADRRSGRESLLVAGIVGPITQAVEEARLAADLGYHLGLISLGALESADDQALVAHCRGIAEVIPIMGFYLQPSVGGRVLGRGFWRELARIPNLEAIKIAPFNRYATIDVLRGVAESGRVSEIALYTGNDDAIVSDLTTSASIDVDGAMVPLEIVGGLLGHWACWTRRAVELLEQCRAARREGTVPGSLLTLGLQVTESNAAIFDPAGRFAGCIPGIHEVLRRQGLLCSRRTLDPHEELSPGQMEEIDRICRAYPYLTDDEFVRENLDAWRS